MSTAPAPDFLTATELSEISSAIQALAGDAQLNRSIVYRKVTSVGTYDPATGTQTPNTSTSTVSGLVSEVSLREVQNSNGILQVGDLKVWIPQSDLAGPLSTDDRLSIAGVNHMILQVTEDPTQTVWRLTARRM